MARDVNRLVLDWIVTDNKIRNGHKFQPSDAATIEDPSLNLGKGKVEVTKTKDVPEKSLYCVGHLQWV